MIYKTNGIKQTRKYGRKSKRNMRGGASTGDIIVFGSSGLIILAGIVLLILTLVGINVFGKSRGGNPSY